MHDGNIASDNCCQAFLLVLMEKERKGGRREGGKERGERGRERGKGKGFYYSNHPGKGIIIGNWDTNGDWAFYISITQIRASAIYFRVV